MPWHRTCKSARRRPHAGAGPEANLPNLANAWRRARYSLLAPVYDLGAAPHAAERRRAVAGLDLGAGDRVLVVGVGTGQDLAALPPEVAVVGVDLSPAMLRHARRRRPDADLRVMDGQALEVRPGSFDAVLLHQVLEVAADPRACLREAARAVRLGGAVSVFDKFLPPAAPSGAGWRSWMRRLADVVFTTTKLSFEELLQASALPLAIERDEACAGPFRILCLRREAGPVPTAAARAERGRAARAAVAPLPRDLRGSG